MVLQSIVRETLAPDGSLFSINRVRLGSYATGGVLVNVRSQYAVVRSSVLEQVGTQVSYQMHTRDQSSPGSLRLFAHRNSAGSTFPQLPVDTVIRGSHHVWMYGDPI